MVTKTRERERETDRQREREREAKSNYQNLMQSKLRFPEEKPKKNSLYATDERNTRLARFKFLFPMTPTKIISTNSS